MDYGHAPPNPARHDLLNRVVFRIPGRSDSPVPTFLSPSELSSFCPLYSYVEMYAEEVSRSS
ncbi:hypothetical protein LEMLEM_LOCUS11274 [Lemmus lemmus]